LDPRAKIFRRDHHKIQSLEGIEKVLRSNDYKNDEYSKGHPMKAICARGDLAKKPQAYGCLDTKVTNYKHFK